MVNGVVYTETMVHSAPERYAADAPYQVAIIDVEGSRKTVRIEPGGRVEIGDSVTFSQERDGVLYYRRSFQD